MTPEETKRLIRAKGLCGHIADERVCILLIGHDQGTHDRGWTVEKCVKDDPYAHDSRCSITVYYVSEGTKTFETDSQVHAEWLADVLTRLDAESDAHFQINLVREAIQSRGWDEDTAVDHMVEYLRQEADNFRIVHRAWARHDRSAGRTRRAPRQYEQFNRVSSGDQPMTTKRSPQRGAFNKPRDIPESILKAVDKGGAIQLDTLAELLGLLATKTDYPFHVAVEVTTGALLKTIDNERDALETIRRLKAAPERTKTT